ncbi:MAG: OmpA family protein [Cytophagaceae bacterium]|nr:OmpA family protein [Gemmatimonadaceae bacterium]
MPTPRRVFSLVIGSALLAAACSKPKPAVVPTPVPVTSNPAPSTPAPAPSTSAPAATNDGNASAIAAAMATLTGAIYFEYDQDALSSDAQAQLDRKLAVLVANPGVGIRLTGHADERGSDEYNLALGQRRAATVKRYLTDRGLSDSRIGVVSMGEERPACTDSADDSCYRRNRRADVEVSSGTITAPPRG